MMDAVYPGRGAQHMMRAAVTRRSGKQPGRGRWGTKSDMPRAEGGKMTCRDDSPGGMRRGEKEIGDGRIKVVPEQPHH